MVHFLPTTVLIAALAVAVSATSYDTTPLCGECGDYKPPCVSGTTCEHGLCKKLDVGAGLFCDSKCSLCGPGLLCEYGVCVTPPPPVAKCGETCSATIKCESGTRCYKRKCTKFVGFGEACDNSCYKCSSHLQCNSYSHKCSYAY
jgi:hypothetical protein